MDNEEKKLDFKTFNELIKTGNILLKITLTMVILAIAILIIYLLDKTSVLVILGKIISILSPLFIGLLIAWLVEPAINYFVKNKVGRKLATVVVYLILIFIIDNYENIYCLLRHRLREVRCPNSDRYRRRSPAHSHSAQMDCNERH